MLLGSLSLFYSKNSEFACKMMNKFIFCDVYEGMLKHIATAEYKDQFM